MTKRQWFSSVVDHTHSVHKVLHLLLSAALYHYKCCALYTAVCAVLIHLAQPQTCIVCCSMYSMLLRQLLYVVKTGARKFSAVLLYNRRHHRYDPSSSKMLCSQTSHSNPKQHPTSLLGVNFLFTYYVSMGKFKRNQFYLPCFVYNVAN